MFLLRPAWGLASKTLKSAWNIRKVRGGHTPTRRDGPDTGTRAVDMVETDPPEFGGSSRRNTLPAFLPAEDRVDETGPTQATNIDGRTARSPSPGRRWHESCSTPVKDSDSGLLDIMGQKPTKLSPAPDEADELASDDAGPMPQQTTPLPAQDSQYHDARRHRHRRFLSEILRKLEDGYETVVGTRLEAHELRGSIRHERQELTDLDARFMQEVRNILLRSPDDRFRPLLDLYEAMDSRRNLLLPKEDDYNILEDQVNTQEFELEETGKKLLEVLEGVRNSLLGDVDLHSSLEDNGDLQSVTSYGNGPLRLELREYQSRIGDRDLVEVRLSELKRERAELVEQEKSLIRIGRVLNKDSRQYLDGFDSQHTSLKEELARIDQDLDNMRKTLESRNKAFFSATQFDEPGAAFEPVPDVVQPVNQYSSPDSNSNVNPSQFPTSPEQNQNSPVLEIGNSDSLAQEPLLLAETDTPTTYSHLSNAEVRSLRHINAWLSDEEKVFPTQFINDWLLSKLRNSRSEIYQYKRSPVLQAVKITQEELKDLVLEWWWSDNAAGDYLKIRNLEAQGFSLSSKAVESGPGAQSDTVLVTMNRLRSQLYTDQAMLQLSKSNVRSTIRRTRSAR